MSVPSSVLGQRYSTTVFENGDFVCGCPDHLQNGRKLCKHVLAVVLWTGTLDLLVQGLRKETDHLSFEGQGGNKPGFNFNKLRGNGNTKRNHVEVSDPLGIFSAKRTFPPAVCQRDSTFVKEICINCVMCHQMYYRLHIMND